MQVFGNIQENCPRNVELQPVPRLLNRDSSFSELDVYQAINTVYPWNRCKPPNPTTCQKRQPIHLGKLQKKCTGAAKLSSYPRICWKVIETMTWQRPATNRRPLCLVEFSPDPHSHMVLHTAVWRGWRDIGSTRGWRAEKVSRPSSVRPVRPHGGETNQCDYDPWRAKTSRNSIRFDPSSFIKFCQVSRSYLWGMRQVCQQGTTSFLCLCQKQSATKHTTF